MKKSIVRIGKEFLEGVSKMNQRFKWKRKSLGEEREIPERCGSCGLLIMWPENVKSVIGWHKNGGVWICNKCGGDIFQTWEDE
jgi:hypothetical protein